TRHQQKQIRGALEQYANNDVITIWFIELQKEERKVTTIPPPLATVAPRVPSTGQTIAFYAPETEPITPTSDNEFNEPVTVAESELPTLLPLNQNFPCALISLPDTAEVAVGDRISGPTPTSSVPQTVEQYDYEYLTTITSKTTTTTNSDNISGLCAPPKSEKQSLIY
ncbi:unnamed protein product, partial [Didymodactylos carnosus]